MKKNKKKFRETEIRREKIENKIWLGGGILFFLAVIIFYGYYFKEDFKFERTIRLYNSRIVPDSIVCMVSDRIISNTPQTITVDGKIYKGCCLSCINKLRSNIENTRFAIDPITRNMVDKASAVIVTVPDGYGKIIYLETKEEFFKYKNQ